MGVTPSGRAWIVGAALLLLCGCERPIALAPSRPRSPSPVSGARVLVVAPQSPAMAEMEAEVRRRINTIRRERGLKRLEAHEKLAGVARAYSRRMAQEGFFEHTSPSGETVAERVRAAGIRFALLGENLFKSVNAPDPVRVAVEGWMRSPGHRENILRPAFTHTGVGIWREGRTCHITQLFIRPLGR